LSNAIISQINNCNRGMDYSSILSSSTFAIFYYSYLFKSNNNTLLNGLHS